MITESESTISINKINLFEDLLKTPFYKDIKLDYITGTYVSDLYLENLRKQKIVIRLCDFTLDMDELRKQTAHFSYKDMYTLWLFNNNLELDKCMIKLINNHGSKLSYYTTEVERKCHKWFYGRIYYIYNSKIYSVHFDSIERWSPSSCDECLEESSCKFEDLTECIKYKPGYSYRPKKMREVSVYPVSHSKIMCIDRKDKLRVAKFNEPAWWKI